MSRKPYVPADFLSKLWRCIIEFDMLHEGDRVLIGLSGGKDSMFLTAALAEVQRYAPVKFELACYTVDTMFGSFPQAELEEFCARYGIRHYSSRVDVTEAWQHRTNTPCFTCAYFRRAATNRTALELGFNKVAWAHHHDDAVETFFLNLVASGQLKTFLPVTPLSRTGLTLIRPLLYYREAEIISMVQQLGLTPLKNPCPYDGNTKRQEAKELLQSLQSFNAEAYEHLASAMRSAPAELWPAKCTKDALTAKFRAFWQQKNRHRQE